MVQNPECGNSSPPRNRGLTQPKQDLRAGVTPTLGILREPQQRLWPSPGHRGRPRGLLSWIRGVWRLRASVTTRPVPVSPPLRGFPGRGMKVPKPAKLPSKLGRACLPKQLTCGSPELTCGGLPDGSSPSPSQPWEEDIIPPTSQMRTLRPGELKRLAQDNTASKRLSQDVNPRPLLLSRVLSPWSFGEN